MPWGVLLILPPRSFTLPAKSTLVAVVNFRDEAIVRLMRLKTTSEVHQVDFCAIEGTEKRLCGHTILEYRYDPVNCKGSASSPPAGFFEFEGIGLEWGCGFLPRSIVAPFFRHWSMMWRARLGRFGLTHRRRTGRMKWRVEWCVMRGIYLWCHFGGDGAALLWNLCCGSGRAVDLEGRGEWIVNSNTSRN